MTSARFEPRRFGAFLLVAELGEDALGRVYRALRLAGERGFVRLRILESPEISEDAVLDAIQANGEIHGFLKNPAIARGVQMDAVDGTPFIAWNETSGRTLDAVLARVRGSGQPMPFEHGLLIAEKIATALDHAYNTTVDEERTLHGLVWPGFVSVSDDGEVRLTGFGLASGFFPTFSRPRFSREIGPYLAREERNGQTIGRNSDVFSVGAILFELLTGRAPSAAEPLADVRAAAETLPPELAEILRMCLGDPESRYKSAGELRRELGKLLFSGSYAPSTFNLAFFLNSLFSADIDAENEARVREALLDPGSVRPSAIAPATAAAEPTPAAAAGQRPRRAPVAIGGALLVAAALAGTAYVLFRRPPPRTITPPAPRPVPTTLPTAPPPPAPTSPPTSGMSEARFKEEVSRRVAAELKRLEREAQQRNAAERRMADAAKRPAAGGSGRQAAPAPAGQPVLSPPPAIARVPAEPGPTARAAVSPTVIPARAAAIPAPTEPPSSAPSSPVLEEPARIKRVIKPIYPGAALRARIGGTVLLRVLVSETGAPIQVEVIRGVTGGLSEAAVAAVRRWTFEPARRNGVPVQGWTTVPIPFEP